MFFFLRTEMVDLTDLKTLVEDLIDIYEVGLDGFFVIVGGFL